MCKFCELKDTWRGRVGLEYQSHKYSPSVYIKEENNDFYLIATADDETKFPVKNCPKCGRELKVIDYKDLLNKLMKKSYRNKINKRENKMLNKLYEWYDNSFN